MMDTGVVQNHDNSTGRVSHYGFLQECQECFGRILFIFLPHDLARTIIEGSEQLYAAMFASGFDDPLFTLANQVC
jgi:hypothetical protein